MYEDDFGDYYEASVEEVFNEFIIQAKEYMKEDIKGKLDSIEYYRDKLEGAYERIAELEAELKRKNSENEKTIENLNKKIESLNKKIDVLKDGNIQAVTLSSTFYTLDYTNDFICNNPKYKTEDLIKVNLPDGTEANVRAGTIYDSTYKYVYYAKKMNIKLLSLKLDGVMQLGIMKGRNIEIINKDTLKNREIFDSIDEAIECFNSEYSKDPKNIWSDELTEKYCKEADNGR